MQVGYSYDVVGYKFTGKERDSESGLDEFGAGRVAHLCGLCKGGVRRGSAVTFFLAARC